MISRPLLKRVYYLVFESLVRGIEETKREIEVSCKGRNWDEVSRENDESLKIAREIWDSFENLEQKINSFLGNAGGKWDTSRLAKTDFALLLIGIYFVEKDANCEKELVKNLSELAWQSGATDNSPKFVSGIIGAAAKEIS